MARDSRSGAATRSGQPAPRRRANMTDSATSEDQCHQKKIFVGGLGHSASTQTLRDYFKRYGTVVDAVVLRWPDGRPRGFGYVTFASAAAATAVLQSNHKIAGSEVDVKRAVPGTNKLFVGGLPQNATAMELREHFEHFGSVSDAVVMMDPATNRSRGFGFVCFSPGQDGGAALGAALEQYDCHRIRGKWIEVKSAAPPRKLAGKEAEVVSESMCVEDDSMLTLPSSGRAARKLAAKGQSSMLAGSDSDGKCSAVPTAGEAAIAATCSSDAMPTTSDLIPPPGLDMPQGPTYVETKSSQALQVVERPRQSSMPQHGLPALSETAPLPSLLAAGRHGHLTDAGCWRGAKAGPVVARSEPMKVPMGGYLTTAGSTSMDEGTDFFEASIDLRHSLEQLLKSQCQQQDSSIAR